jgi:glycosyltransferase involved in cell wall biosynthesis
VVYNGVQLPEPELSRSEWRCKLNIKERDAVVVMLANFREDKGHELLLQAWQQVVKGAKHTPVLVLAGAHQQNYENIQQLTCQLDLDSCVRFPGHVQDVSGLLRASDIGVLVSPAEGLPNAVLEYMAAGLPVSASDVAGVREALGAETAGVFDGASCDEIAEKLLHWMNLPEDANRSGVSNRLRISKEFSLEKMCSDMEREINLRLEMAR